MSVRELVTTLTVPIEVEIYGGEAEYLFTRSSIDCEDLYDLTVIRWWPESREKIVVFLDFAGLSVIC